MNKITLKKLSITNFKGIKSLDIDFSDNTNIYAANGVGKTTIFDAFTWLLFGKDSQDRKDFEIKPLDENGLTVPKTENEVTGILNCNGEEIVLKRVHREKWVKKRGLAEAEFSGNETIYFWNDVPMAAKDYTSKINELLNEQVFKLITNPLAFNNLKWQDRRKVLIDIAGNVEVDFLSHGLENILELTKKKTISELKAEISSKITKIKNEIKLIPTRIDEVQKSKPEQPDIKELENTLFVWNKDLESIEGQLLDSSKANEEINKKKSVIQNQIFEIKTKIQQIEFELKSRAVQETQKDTSKIVALERQLNDAKFEFQNALNSLTQIVTSKENKQKELDYIEAKKNALRSEWTKINAETLSFNENDFHCPACKREFESGDIESKKAEMLSNFNNSKAARLQQINNSGLNLKTESEFLAKDIEELDSRINNGKTFADKCKSEIDSLQSAIELEKSILDSTEAKCPENVYIELLSNHAEYQSSIIEIEKLQKELTTIQPIQNNELIELKKQTQANIDIVKRQLSVVDQINAADQRINELKHEESNLSQSLLDLEKIEFDVERYIKLNIEALEEKINEKFQFVSFKLFDTQINGGQVECCEALIEGVPFDNANTASKINAGVDIINTLCDFYKTNAPIFIDNRESVTDLIDSKSQIISLIVSKTDKKIRIENQQLELIPNSPI